ncbi:hypothetical protein L1987_08832 [Smallanthus sonchifolius]|uniref:Uncharacterized protein n=1 Tax=Smallanthus sonchifolius TaxID=185202 RepID=A0ACB9JNM8_9ASTR|nr:hypothetical protein L1987_08832 [Smallanthus sonchifolius]
MGMGTGASSSSSRNVNLNLYNEMRNEFSKRAQESTPSSELRRYIGTNFLSFMSSDVFEDFDILAWWKGNEATFSFFSVMASDVLSVQASTFASESVFSDSGRVLSIRITRLTPVAMEICVCLKDHLDAVERIQDTSSLEDEIEVEEFIHETEVNQGLANPLTDEELAEDDTLRGSASNSEHSEHDDKE